MDELDAASREGGASVVAMETRTGGLGLSEYAVFAEMVNDCEC